MKRNERRLFPKEKELPIYLGQLSFHKFLNMIVTWWSNFKSLSIIMPSKTEEAHTGVYLSKCAVDCLAFFLEFFLFTFEGRYSR